MNCKHRTSVIHSQDTQLPIKSALRNNLDQISLGSYKPLAEHSRSLHPFTVRSRPQPVLLQAKIYIGGQATVINGILGLPQRIPQSWQCQQRERTSHSFDGEVSNARPIDLVDGYGEVQSQGGGVQLLQLPVIPPTQFLYIAGGVLYAGTALRFVNFCQRGRH